MMPHIDAALFSKKGLRRSLTLILDEGDSIIDSIKASMQEHGLNEVRIEGAEGAVQETTINYFERSQFRSTVLNGNRIMVASGNYKLSYGELFGTFKLATEDKPPIQGTLVKGKAAQGLTINLSFIEYVDKPPKAAQVR